MPQCFKLAFVEANSTTPSEIAPCELARYASEAGNFPMDSIKEGSGSSG